VIQNWLDRRPCSTWTDDIENKAPTTVPMLPIRVESMVFPNPDRLRSSIPRIV
jgi:hypothetical protein